MLRSLIFLFIGVVACSTSAIQLRACSLSPDLISTVRLLLGATILAPLYFRDRKRYPRRPGQKGIVKSLIPALALAFHFLLWAWGAQITPAAQATLLVNLSPVALPFFLLFLTGERITRKEILATGLTFMGLVIISSSDLLSGGTNFMGDAICFGAMLLFTWYLALGRQNRNIPSVWLYVVPLYFKAGLFCLIISLPRMNSLVSAPLTDWLLLAGVAIIPTAIGHTLLNLAIRHLRGQIVSLANTGQFIFTGILAWLIFSEIPQASFYPAALLVSVGISLAIIAGPMPNPIDESNAS